MGLTYKECDQGSAKNTNIESVVGYILLLSWLRRKFPLSSLGSVIYPLSFAFQLTIPSEFFLLQPQSLSIALLPEFLLICLQFGPSFPGTHSMYFSFISKLCYLHLSTAASQEGREKWEVCARSQEQCKEHVSAGWQSQSTHSTVTCR